MSKHPNAAAAGLTSALAAALVWAASLAGVTVPDWAAALIAGAAASAVLFVGREGLRGTWRRLLDGSPPPRRRR
jgi:hypothetical protein